MNAARHEQSIAYQWSPMAGALSSGSEQLVYVLEARHMRRRLNADAPLLPCPCAPRAADFAPVLEDAATLVVVRL